MMKVNLMMETCKFMTILFLYCVCTAYCYPTRPLNERSPELTWQAWLLVDDQNQNKQQTHSDGALRRRITPKSVFIAPTFLPESLPPCADGYSSDQMGRCIKIIKLDQAAHREFIIEKLREQFGAIDYDDDAEEDTPTSGPLQINIPLNVSEEDSDEDTDVAIIVSPTKTFMENIGISLDKRDSLDDEHEQEIFLKKLAETTTNKPDEITTITEQATTLDNADLSTIPGDLTPVTEPIKTVGDDMSTSTEARSVKRSTTDAEEVTTDITEDYPGFTTESSTATPKETTVVPPKRKVQSPLPNFRFPDVPARVPSVVKFPESYTFQTQIPSSVDDNSDIHDTARYLNEQAVYSLSDRPASDTRVVFRDQSHRDYNNGVHTQLSSTTMHRGYNRRNRDKHSGMFLLPPRWSQPNFQKPLVLRFSRKHAYLDESQFKNPDYYRSVPTDDFAYLFKFKHKQLNRR